MRPGGADKDPEGYYAVNGLTFAAMGYNTRLVKPEEAPKSLAELLEPKQLDLLSHLYSSVLVIS